ncbi:MAG: COX15/CtaA family protein [Planctomycetaceae bacterium]|nr:COX15/CtaA family protein [Planctomycetaceae bacterium]
MNTGNEQTETHSRLMHGMAVLTVVVSLLPILVGAITTTLDAGMAFPDWPTSDGYGMLTYPWLRSAGDQFVEHGHRLAGMLIGFVSIGLAGVALRYEPRKWVRVLSYLVLLAVICQGLLGGSRVRLDARVLAMIHGSFAAVVFSLMGVVALVTGRRWRNPVATASQPAESWNQVVSALRSLAVITSVLVFCQFLAGGFVRHLHTALHEHLGLAILVTILSFVLTFRAARLPVGWLKWPALALGGVVLLQILLGAGAWVTRFGFATTGYVAVYHSPAQIWLRTAHTLGGMLVLMAAVTLACRVYRLAWLYSPAAARPERATAHHSATFSRGAS